MDRAHSFKRSLLAGFVPVLCILTIAAGLATWRHLPPAPLPVDAPADVFSAHRAFPILEKLVGDCIPHPNGSPQNDVVREGILKAFQEMGYAPEVQEAVVDRRSRPFTVRNIMARLEAAAVKTVESIQPGSPRSSVLLMSHYDSVPDGPGASDAGVSVAVILEVARLLRAAPPPGNNVIFLITDGEEYGLLGAQAFVAEHPWSRETGIVVNLEARGTSGLSLMFETGEKTSWLAGRMVDSLVHPATNSLMATVYQPRLHLGLSQHERFGRIFGCTMQEVRESVLRRLIRMRRDSQQDQVAASATYIRFVTCKLLEGSP